MHDALALPNRRGTDASKVVAFSVAEGTKLRGLPPEKRTSRRTRRSLEPNRAGQQRPLGCKPTLPAS
jgi:hypothetical protein